MITAKELHNTVDCESALVLALGEAGERLPGEQMNVTLENLAEVTQNVSKERLIVTHCT